MSEPVYIVSGLPRSGASMMMRMLDAGGLDPITDKIREADDDNPRGYYELEAVKRTKQDDSWLDDAPGKVVKVISQLLADLPDKRKYKIIFMRRKLDEILASQKKMLDRRGEQDGAKDDDMKITLTGHVEEVEAWMRGSAHVEVLFVNYNRMIAEPEAQAVRVNKFLGDKLDLQKMVEVVEPSLYRNRA